MVERRESSSWLVDGQRVMAAVEGGCIWYGPVTRSESSRYWHPKTQSRWPLNTAAGCRRGAENNATSHGFDEPETTVEWLGERTMAWMPQSSSGSVRLATGVGSGTSKAFKVASE